MILFKDFPKAKAEDKARIFRTANFVIVTSIEGRREGLLALEDFRKDDGTIRYPDGFRPLAENQDDAVSLEEKFFYPMLRQIVDGTDQEVLATSFFYLASGSGEKDGALLSLMMGAEGLLSVQRGDNPVVTGDIMKAMMGPLLAADFKLWYDDDSDWHEDDHLKELCDEDIFPADYTGEKAHSETAAEELGCAKTDDFEVKDFGDSLLNRARTDFRTYAATLRELILKLGNEKSREALGDYGTEEHVQTLLKVMFSSSFGMGENKLTFEGFLERMMLDDAVNEEHLISAVRRMDKTERSDLYKLLEERGLEELKDRLEKQLYAVKMLASLSDREVQKVLRDTGSGTLARALADDGSAWLGAVKEKILSNMSQRMRAYLMMSEKSLAENPPSKDDIDNARLEISDIMKKLEKEGDIRIRTEA